MNRDSGSSLIKQIALLLLGSFAASTAVIFIKKSHLEPSLLAGSRCLIAAILLSPVYFRYRAKHPNPLPGSNFKRIFAPALILSLHFSSWALGARMTPAANSSLIVNFVPMVMPFFMYFLSKEKLTLQEFVGTIISMAGMFYMVFGDLHFDEQYFWGDVVCFLSMLGFCLYLYMAKLNRDVPVIWLYTIPLYFWSGVFSLILSLTISRDYSGYGEIEILWILCLAVIPTILGHSILNHAMKKLRSQVVAIANLSQCIFAGIMAFFLLGEAPAIGFYVAAAALIVGLTVAIRK